MIKTEDVKIETIESPTKVGEKIETIYPETIQVPDYDYGTSQNTLDAWLSLRNLAKVATTGSYNDLTDKPTTTWAYYIATVTFSVPSWTPTQANLTVVNSTTGMNVTPNFATIVEAWVYQVSANITWNSLSTTWVRELAVDVNSWSYFIVTADDAKSTWWSYSNLSGAKYFNAWDTVRLMLYQDSWLQFWQNWSSNEFSIVKVW